MDGITSPLPRDILPKDSLLHFPDILVLCYEKIAMVMKNILLKLMKLGNQAVTLSET